jgi:copper chaperone
MSEFKVPDMSCGHCEKAITKALKAANSSADVKVDLNKKTVEVTNVPDETVVELLKDIGYTPEKMK